jgi:hypothetical protein
VEGREIAVGGDPAELRLGRHCARGEGKEEMQVGGELGAPFIGGDGRGGARLRRWGKGRLPTTIVGGGARMGAAVSGEGATRRVGAPTRIEGNSVGRRRGSDTRMGEGTGMAVRCGRPWLEEGAAGGRSDPDRWGPAVGEWEREKRR